MKWIHNLIIFLAISTILIIALYLNQGDNKVLDVGTQDFTYFKTNDQVQGGTSTSELLLEGRAQHLLCDLNTSKYLWPYCGISIHVNEDPTKGIDLSNYHTLRIKMKYETPEGESPRQVRVYLRNYNEAYSDADNEYTHKYNGIQFAPGNEETTINIPLRNLQVMTWWLADNNISVEHSGLEFSNVNKIEIATGSGAKVGNHDMTFYSIELVGQYIAAEDLFLTLLIIWITVGSTLSIYEIAKTRKAIASANARHAHLEQVNNSLKIQNDQFAEKAHRDALTGALNRHAIVNWLEDQSNSVRWGQSSLSILFLDIDHFKPINDLYGHNIGDDILKEFVLVVRNASGNMDRLVRWGGEEFILFCPNTSLGDAQIKAEHIKQKVANHNWIHGSSLTCSIGVSEMGEERTTEAIARADDALYKAKRTGRNKVVVNYGQNHLDSESA